MKKLSKFLIVLIYLSSFFKNIACSLISNPNYLDYEYVTISNLQGTCRFCKNLLSNNFYSFGQCSLTSNSSQSFHVLRGTNCNS